MKARIRKLLSPPPHQKYPTLPPPLRQSNAAAVAIATPPMLQEHSVQPPQLPFSNTPFDSSFALVILALLTALFFMGFFSLYIRRFAEQHSSSSGSAEISHRRSPDWYPTLAPPYVGPPSCSDGSKGVDPNIIASLPRFVYSGEAEYQMECAVCLSDLEEEEAVKVIPRCRHVFHAECIGTWLSSHVSCPVCRNSQLMEARKGGHGEGEGREGNDRGVSGAEERRRMVRTASNTCEGSRGGGGERRRNRSCSSLVEAGERQRPSLQRRTSF